MGYTKGTKLYRAEALYGNVSYREFEVLRETLKGGWVHDSYTGKQRFVLQGGRWASVTEEDALDRLCARKRSHVKHAKRRLKNAEEDLRTAERGQKVPGLFPSSQHRWFE